jgi:hypothetical protein
VRADRAHRWVPTRSGSGLGTLGRCLSRTAPCGDEDELGYVCAFQRDRNQAESCWKVRCTSDGWKSALIFGV